jgi:DNA-directed RNA polymerase specialized sigma subunit
MSRGSVYSLLLAFFLLSLPVHAIEEGNAKSKCSEQISSIKNGKKTKAEGFWEKRERFATAAAQLVKTASEFPTMEQLAEKLKVEVGEIEAFFVDYKRSPEDILGLIRLGLEMHSDLQDYLNARLAKVVGEHIKDSFRLPTKEELYDSVGIQSDEEFHALYGEPESLWKLVHQHRHRDIELTQKKVMRAYVNLARITGRTPAPEQVAEELHLMPEEFVELFDAQIGRKRDKRLFESFLEVKEGAYILSPSSFTHVLDSDIFNEERQEALLQAVKSRKRLIITSAVSGAPVNQRFFSALKNYADRMDAEIIVIPVNMVTNELDPVLLNTPGVHIMIQSVEVSKRLILDNLKIMGNMKDPLSSTEEAGPRGQSRIFCAPKFRSKVVPTVDNQYYPHRLMTTGSLTDGNWAGKHWISKRQARLFGTHEHKMGAIVLERNRGRTDFLDQGGYGQYHMRQIEWIEHEDIPEKDWGFGDLDKYYLPNGKVRDRRPAAVVLGDMHAGVTKQTLMAAVLPKLKRLRPREIVLHDILDGRSINHHEQGRALTLAKKAERGELNLEEELKMVAAYLNGLLAVDPEVQLVIAKSNHDLWLNAYLQAGGYLKDSQNTRLGTELAMAMQQGKDPLEYYLLEYGIRFENTRTEEVRAPAVDDPQRVRFLPAGTVYKVGHVEGHQVVVSFHGHKGANGKRANLRSMKKAADRMVYGHTHTEERDRDTLNIGTSTILDQSYMVDGVSSWVNSLAIVHDFGELQAVAYTESQLFMDEDEEFLEDDQFFPRGYPRLLPFMDDRPMDPDDPGQVDQYSRFGKGGKSVSDKKFGKPPTQDQ